MMPELHKTQEQRGERSEGEMQWLHNASEKLQVAVAEKISIQAAVAVFFFLFFFKS